MKKISKTIPIIDLAAALSILKRGGVIAYPTETVYGIGGDALNPKSVENVFFLKNRSPDSPISVLIPDASSIEQWVETVSPFAREAIARFWPGPLTLLFWARPIFPAALLGGTKKIGIRVSSHPLADQLVKAFGRPLMTTSANRSGEAAARNARTIQAAFGDQPDKVQMEGILSGEDLPFSMPSTIIDTTEDPAKILRQGSIDLLHHLAKSESSRQSE